MNINIEQLNDLICLLKELGVITYKTNELELTIDLAYNANNTKAPNFSGVQEQVEEKPQTIFDYILPPETQEK